MSPTPRDFQHRLMDLYIESAGCALGSPVDVRLIEEVNEEQAKLFEEAGYRFCRVTDLDAFELAYASVESCLNRTSPDDIHCVIYAVEPSVNSSNNWMMNAPRWQRKDIRWLLQKSSVRPRILIGLSMFNCATFLSAIQLSERMYSSDKLGRTLIVMSGVCNESSPRVPHWRHLQSDGAAALVLSPEPPDHAEGFAVRGLSLDIADLSQFRAIDGQVDEEKYYAYKARGIRSAAEAALTVSGTTPEAISRFYVQNLGHRAMNAYGKLCSVSEQAIFTDGLASNAHVIGVDTLVNWIEDSTRSHPVAGELSMLLGTSGMAWGALILETI